MQLHKVKTSHQENEWERREIKYLNLHLRFYGISTFVGYSMLNPFLYK